MFGFAVSWVVIVWIDLKRNCQEIAVELKNSYTF